jgi:hypothetical protein
MRMMRKTATLAIAAALGTGAAIGLAACGEDRAGDVQFETETGTTGTTGTETTGTTGTETTGTEPTGTETTGTETTGTETTGTETTP